jgi:hypothetical protein
MGIIRREWLLVLLAVTGIAVHGGTAALRIQTFVPYPKLLDFSAFYTSARALRSGLSPYGIPVEFSQGIQDENRLPFRPPQIYNPPVWPWLLQPLAAMPFRPAAWVWLIINLALLGWTSFALTRLAGYDTWWAKGSVFLLALTFGPVFLDLTLGQTSVVLLALAVAIGSALRPGARHGWLFASLAEGVAAGVKLFPLIWLGGAVLLRRWKLVLLGMAATLLVFGIGYLASPPGNQDYWFRFLPERVTSASDNAGLDDQSWMAWLGRLALPQAHNVPGISVQETVHVVWTPLLPISPAIVRWGGYLTSILLGLPVVIALLRCGNTGSEGGFYLWVLYALLVFPHIERYNHTLLLPAMAWLWGQGASYRWFVLAAYVLTGFARLNHLWAILLPVPWGPLAAGFGVYAVLLLGIGMVAAMRRSRPVGTHGG